MLDKYTSCNLYQEIPSFSCSCDSTCGCWETVCKESIQMSGGMDSDNTHCIRCGSWVGEFEVHEIGKGCVSKYEKGKFSRLDVKEGSKLETPTPSDEDLAKLFFDYVRNSGIPHVPDLDSHSQFEDLSLRDVKAMAAFVKEMRK